MTAWTPTPTATLPHEWTSQPPYFQRCTQCVRKTRWGVTLPSVSSRTQRFANNFAEGEEDGVETVSGGFGTDPDDIRDNFSSSAQSNSKSKSKSNGSPTEKQDAFSLGETAEKWLESRSGINTVIDTGNNDNDNKEKRELTSYTNEDIAGNVNIPKTGISVSDEMTALQCDETYLTKLVPLIDDAVPKGVRAARIDTTIKERKGDEPARYLVPFQPYHDQAEHHLSLHYAMVDIPPYSDRLADDIRSFLNRSNGTLTDILITSIDGVHYDESPAVYVTRRSDLGHWKQAFPKAHLTIYRLDAPRECKDLADQVLDGYGPWATTTHTNVHNNDHSGDDANAATDTPTPRFLETGRPLTRNEWNEEIQHRVLDQGLPPPDDDDDDERNADTEGLYTPTAIKQREQNKDVVVVYTPGHTFGSLSFVFPNVAVCCSGYTLPLEDTRPDAAMGSTMPGPMMDYRGYITTNRGGMNKQIESARFLINVYGDRFRSVLPSRGSPVCLRGDEEDCGGEKPDCQETIDYRARVWNQLLDDYAEVGRVYDQLGII